METNISTANDQPKAQTQPSPRMSRPHRRDATRRSPGLRTLSYNLTVYTSTWSRVSATESPSWMSWTSWNTTSITATTETVFIKLGTLEAEAFVVRFKEADFQTRSNTAPTSRSTAPSSETTASMETHTKEQGLTSSAKAGIGVGAMLGALLLVAVGLAIFWLRKKKLRRHSDNKKPEDKPEWTVEVDGAQVRGELPTRWSTAELHGQPMPPTELHASRYREVNPDEPAELGDAPTSGR